MPARFSLGSEQRAVRCRRSGTFKPTQRSGPAVFSIPSSGRQPAEKLIHLPITRTVPITIRLRGVELRLIRTERRLSTARADLAMLKTVARAYHWSQDLLSGRVRSVEEIAEREQVGPCYVTRLLRLAFLAPKIVEGIAAGTQPYDLTAEALAERVDLPPFWSEQERTVLAN